MEIESHLVGARRASVQQEVRFVEKAPYLSFRLSPATAAARGPKSSWPWIHWTGQVHVRKSKNNGISTVPLLMKSHESTKTPCSKAERAVRIVVRVASREKAALLLHLWGKAAALVAKAMQAMPGINTAMFVSLLEMT